MAYFGIRGCFSPSSSLSLARVPIYGALCRGIDSLAQARAVHGSRSVFARTLRSAAAGASDACIALKMCSAFFFFF